MRRKVSFGLLAFLMLGTSIPAQTVSQVKSPEANDSCEDVETVRSILEERRHNFSSGVSIKANSRLGDGVSVALIKLYGPNELSDLKNVRLFLPIIRASFPPKWEGDRPCNREPKVTVFFLRWLQAKTRDPRLKRDISRTIKAVEVSSELKAGDLPSNPSVDATTQIPPSRL